ncbi:FAD-dependent oxidoreductase [Aquincola sp. S2]|uniref:FAD-dependent oxidoreductase n=1 Tax=Pseudaquabacterium terrae TaxID=2732868 RepID=A0ABX2EJ21_9BURK|nr:hydroxysqualene dehydroxylase HpnE [Aquabacterium terrae]NRF68637.1 FAD-dependent oxidoreductase [Aquabacterium terrae]
MSAASRLPREVAVVGAGWAGLSAAVRATEQGHRVTLFEMARRPGGRARGVPTPAGELDNGQHILIGAYHHTLALMRTVGADPAALLHRMPLRLRYPDGRGLELPAGSPLTSFLRGVATARGWSARERLALLLAATGWLLRGFRCAPDASVATLCRRLPRKVIDDLVEPLCVAALNTPMQAASAQVFLRVLRDALFSGAGSADLLLPRASLSALLPEPAVTWLQAQGAVLHFGRRVMGLQAAGAGWLLDGQRFDAVVLACSAVEAARLTGAFAPAWSRQAATLRYEPIVTAYLHDPRLRLAAPVLALAAGAEAPAQFVFDLGALGRTPGCFAFVVSGAAPWVERGLAATAVAVMRQARLAFPTAFLADDDAVLLHIAAEQRATFACTPGLVRPPRNVAPGLSAAGDYVDGPYPATLEGSVRAAEQALALALAAQAQS